MGNNYKPVGIITYCRTSLNSYRKSGFFKLSSLPIIIVSVVLFFVMQLTKADIYPDLITLVYLFNAVLMLASECARVARENKIELYRLLPMTYKRRAAFECLSWLILSAIAFFIALAVVFAALLLPGIFASCVLYELAVLWEFIKMFGNLAVNAGLFGALFLLSYSLLTYGVSLVYGYLKSFGARTGLICGYGAGITAFALLVFGYGTEGGVTGELARLPFGYAAVAVFALAAAALIIYGFYLSIKIHKPQNY